MKHPLHTVIDRFIRDEIGAATAEYAIATMAAVGLAGVLVTLLKGDLVRSLLEGIIKSAFHFGG